MLFYRQPHTRFGNLQHFLVFSLEDLEDLFSFCCSEALNEGQEASDRLSLGEVVRQQVFSGRLPVLCQLQRNPAAGSYPIRDSGHPHCQGTLSPERKFAL